MESIKNLPDDLINKIAAGEVVERPASVVKELIENAIDAGADKITIEVFEGGKKEITVKDNGNGIKKSQILKALQRHCTSKISTFDDLIKVNTLGFRGEALASIASVSLLRIESRHHQEETGSYAVLLGGKEKEKGDSPIPVGTVISVKNLFYNVPARKKYLKSTATEYSHILSLIHEYALAYPGKSFAFISDAREVLRAPSVEKAIFRIGQIYGKNTAENMIYMEAQDSSCGYFMKGYLGRPESCRKDTSKQMFCVNGRVVRINDVVKTINEAYKKYLMKHQQPIYIIDFYIEPSFVDVNVHPKKTYVKFSNEEKVMDFIFRSIRVCLYNSLDIREADTKVLEAFGDKKSNALTEKNSSKITSQTKKTHDYSSATSEFSQPLMENCETAAEPYQSKLPEDTLTIPGAHSTKPYENNHKFMGNVIPLGQILNTYIIAADLNNIYIIDQHAAHERVVYEELLNKKNNEKTRQNLLFPLKIELSTSSNIKIERNMEKLKAIGFEISEFGENCVIIEAVPSVLGRNISPERFMEILSEIDEIRDDDSPESLERMITTIACHSAIRAGEPLELSKMADLLEHLKKSKNPFMCPHGRPSVIRISEKELEKMFRRVV